MNPRNHDVRGLPPAMQKRERQIRLPVEVTVDPSGGVIGLCGGGFAYTGLKFGSHLLAGDGVRVFKGRLVLDPEPIR